MRYLVNFLLVAICAACNPIYASTPTSVLAPTSKPSLVLLKFGVWHNMIFHDQVGEAVLVNGGNAPSTVLSDTWEWDGQNWICAAGCT